MPTKLNWVYDDHARVPSYTADYKGLRLRAEHDQDAVNSFEDHDGHWPMLVRHDGCTVGYDTKTKGVPIDAPLDRFTDQHLVHDQKAIGALLDVTSYDIPEEAGGNKWCRDPGLLREIFENAIGDVRDSDKLDTYAKLYELLGIPCLNTQSTGYCQGDWAELLIVATPEAVAEFGWKGGERTPEDFQKDLESQAKLYGAWAWGDVYGFIVERPLPVEDENDDPEYEDLDSCWGFYGSDFAWSGLEDAAIEAADAYVKESEDA